MFASVCKTVHLCTGLLCVPFTNTIIGNSGISIIVNLFKEHPGR